jgi:hypothetical protein
MDTLIKDLTSLSRVSKSLGNAVKAVHKPEEDPVKRLSLLKKALTVLERGVKAAPFDSRLDDRVHTVIASVTREIHELEDTAKAEFGRKLEVALRSEGFTLEGNYPLLRAGIFSFDVDISADRVDLYYGPEFEKLDTARRAIPEEVMKLVIKHHASIVKRPLDDADFLAQLREAYNICLIELGRKIGEEVPISEVHWRFTIRMQPKKFRNNPKKLNFIEYSRSMFSYDLSRLRDHTLGSSELKLITALRGETRRAQDTLWIPPASGKGLGETISRLKFTEA